MCAHHTQNLADADVSLSRVSRALFRQEPRFVLSLLSKVPSGRFAPIRPQPRSRRIPRIRSILTFMSCQNRWAPEKSLWRSRVVGRTSAAWPSCSNFAGRKQPLVISIWSYSTIGPVIDPMFGLEIDLLRNEKYTTLEAYSD